MVKILFRALFLELEENPANKLQFIGFDQIHIPNLVYLLVEWFIRHSSRIYFDHSLPFTPKGFQGLHYTHYPILILARSFLQIKKNRGGSVTIKLCLRIHFNLHLRVTFDFTSTPRFFYLCLMLIFGKNSVK